MFATILPVLRGNGEVIIKKHLIDCDADPFIPERWQVEEHRKGGQLEWDKDKIQLYLSKDQKSIKCIAGHKLREELENQLVLNANVLDCLLAHPDLIPEDWKNISVFFWGTIYSGSDGDLCVRNLYRSGDKWYWSYDWLGSAWDYNDPAVLLAS